MDIIHQFLILTKKNLLLRKRRYIITGLELVVPFLVSFIFVLISDPNGAGHFNTKTNPAAYYPPIKLSGIKDLTQLDNVDYTLYQCTHNCIIAYTPMSNQTYHIMNQLRFKLHISNPGFNRSVAIAGFINEETMNENYTRQILKFPFNPSKYHIVMGIIFHEVDNDGFTYTIRKPSEDTTFSNYYTDYVKNYFYNYNTFLIVQHFLDDIYMNYISTDSQKQQLNKTEIYIQAFPHPKYKSVKNMVVIPTIITFTIVSMLTLFVPSFIVRIVQEKNSGLRELLRTIGLRTSVNYCAWFLHGFMFLLMISFIILFFLSVKIYTIPFLSRSDKFLTWIFLIFYIISLLLFCLSISIFFSRAIYAVVFSIVVCQLTALGPVLGMDSESDSYTFAIIPFAPKMISCFIPNTALYWGFKIIMHLEIKGSGLHWSTINKSITESDSFSILYVMLMMIASWFFYIVAIWYFDTVWPWQAGVPRPFHFFLTRSYWFGNKVENSHVHSKGAFHEAYHEDLQLGLEIGIDIRNITKKPAIYSILIYSRPLTKILNCPVLCLF